jgi:hypothetical protein
MMVDVANPVTMVMMARLGLRGGCGQGDHQGQGGNSGFHVVSPNASDVSIS